MAISLTTIPCLDDNFCALIVDDVARTAILVDASEEAPIERALTAGNLRLTDILITHHHHDHVAALSSLKARHSARVHGPAAEARLIGALDRELIDGERLMLNGVAITALATPGHSIGHMAFAVEAPGRFLFTGDCLFALGCGRVADDDFDRMWASLAKLKALGPDWLCICGHEYTLSNARFARHVDPANAALAAYATEAEDKRREGRFTVPFPLGREFATNPFLRADDPALAERMGMGGATPAAVFRALREAKNGFRG